MPKLPPGSGRKTPVHAAKTPSNSPSPALKNVVHRGTPTVGPAPTPRISAYVTASWAWADITTGLITWTFTNSDPNNSHAVVLYRGGAETPTYIFGGAYWPIYLAGGFGTNMLDGTQPLPTLSSGSTQPMGILDFGPSASPRYLVAFIFNLGPGQTFNTNEGFTPNAGPTTYQCYALDSSVTGNYCVGYDPGRVANYNSNPLAGSTQAGYSPNPKVFYTYAFTPESATPDNELGYNDSIAAGSCATPNFYFVTNQNEFGRDEVADNPDYPLAFYLFLEGYTPNAVGTSIPSFSNSSSFNSANIPGLSYPPDAVPVTYDLGGRSTAYADVPQRIRFGYDVNFTSASLASATAFPAAGSSTPNAYTLQASISILGQADALTPQAEFYLLGGDDPYFTNINTGPAAGVTQPYLSQDLRVFTGTPALDNTPVAGPGPIPSIAPPTLTDSVAGAYNYIGQLITWLNQQYGYLNPAYTPPDTNVSDPLDSLLPVQNGALNGDSSATPFTGTDRNYNFAIARVRLKGSSGVAAQASNVKVFFRLMTTQTFDTDYINSTTATTTADPQVTYPSTGSLNDPQSPLPGTDHSGNVNGCSLPFFATANFNSSPTDYSLGGVNNQDIEIPATHDYAWAFYGCFLNVNDATNTYGTLPFIGPVPVQAWLSGSAHNCLVAQIAYNLAPIINENGVIESPENSNKLAQRNCEVTTSGNPGFPATHQVPQTIDVRPSPPPQSTDPTSILSYPDEMMIDWGSKMPLGSVATLYWPGVSASAVLQLASQLYPAQTLTSTDAHTIQFTVSSPVTYIPIPTGSGGSFAGLITVQLPSTVRYGNEFDVVVRRITTKQVIVPNRPPQPPQPVPQVTTKADKPRQFLWRYITGSFLAKVQVEEAKKTLPIDENLLAILKWRLGLIGKSNRWYPVLLRYIHLLTGRIDGGGGDASKIPASPNGYQLPTAGHGHGHGHGEHHHGEHCCTGKVIGIAYDRFGDFEGFEVLTEEGCEHFFRGREPQVEELVRRAWIDRSVISICVEAHCPHWPASIVLRRPH